MGSSDSGSSLEIKTDRVLPGPFQKYNYASFIKNPKSMGMSGGSGNSFGLNQIATNFGSLIAYVELLVNGSSPASRAVSLFDQDKPYAPLGNAYTFKTGFQCTDTNGNLQDAVSYINNVPMGNIPFISQLIGGNATSLRGLLPGMFENLNGFNPMIIVDTLAINNGDPCNASVANNKDYYLPVTNISEDGRTYDDSSGFKTEFKSAYMFDSMVNSIDPCMFKGGENPVNGRTCPTINERFTNINDDPNDNKSDIRNNSINVQQKLENDLNANIDMLTQLSKENWIVELYYISLSILFIFIIIKILHKK